MDNEKKYKLIVGKIKKAYLYAQTDSTKAVLEDILPELRESEGERIRKEIISALKYANHKGVYDKHLAWLEKQGNKSQGKSAQEAINEAKVDYANKVEPKDYSSIDPHFGKPIDKLKPKPHEGEWLCENEPNNYARFIQILEVVDVQGKERYRISRDLHNDEDVAECRFIKNNYHSFTIQDVKDGDVLSDGNTIFIFKDLLSDNSVVSYCDYDTDSGESDAFCPLPMNLMCSKITPATKEQREQLEKAIADAGYIFNFEKKKLKKVEQKSAWSEDDERERKRIIGLLEGWLSTFKETCYAEDCECGIDWLKSLKGRVQPQPKQEWSEKDEAYKIFAISAVEEYYDKKIPYRKDLVDWLRSLKDRYAWKPSDEQKVM